MSRTTKGTVKLIFPFQTKLAVERFLLSQLVPLDRFEICPSDNLIAPSKAKPELVGKYSRVGSDATGRIVYKKDSTFLHYAVDVAYKFEAWIFSSSADDLMGEV